MRYMTKSNNHSPNYVATHTFPAHPLAQNQSGLPNHALNTSGHSRASALRTNFVV